MDSINIADLKDELDRLIDRLEAGEAVQITRNGRPFARVTPEAPPLPRRKPIDVDGLEALAKSLPYDPTSARDLVRQMRDDSRY
ncbi:type II toxin-antitoxin system Phd/YefM family antitoxin [Sphingomonas faeni]|uniref:type II toxin-antitoxin system Phd/YefM family antitoxin n=1 Tax=Sphingomonas faeni TaxID=185950 RepID=UPI00335AB8B4